MSEQHNSYAKLHYLNFAPFFGFEGSSVSILVGTLSLKFK